MDTYRYQFRASCLMAAMFLALFPATRADALSIQFNYVLDTGFFNNNQAAKDALEYAADTFEPFLDTLAAIVPGGVNTWTAEYINPATGNMKIDTNPSVPMNTLVIYAGARDLSGSTLGMGGPGGYRVSGYPSFVNTVVGRGEGNGTTAAVQGPTAYDFGPWGGSIAFDTTRSDGLPQLWHYGIDTTPGPNQNDFLSVAIHELAHVLGFGTSDSFANRITTHQFTGTEASLLYGGNVPMATDDSHWENGTISPNQGETAMDPSIITGHRKLFTALDYAAMDDLGWQVPASLLQPPSLVPGDFNQDGGVDRFDFTIWQNDFGTLSGAAVGDGDADGDGDVDGGDFLVWQRNFGQSNAARGPGSGAGAVLNTVPEPAAMMLASCMLILPLLLRP